jgi:hypothetical protein
MVHPINKASVHNTVRGNGEGAADCSASIAGENAMTS